MKTRKNSLADELKVLIEKTKKNEVTIRTTLSLLPGRGHALLLILLSLPFCQPIQIPGFSFFFGILIGFIGLRIAFGHRTWVPKFILDRTISKKTIIKIASVAIKLMHKLRYFIYTRLTWIVKWPIAHVFHGLTIFLLAILLALPIPIPLTNLLVAYPILFFGIGLLEDDGLLIIFAYLLSLIAIASFIALFWLGAEGLITLINGVS